MYVIEDIECDHVIHFENGKYGLIETKLGAAQTDYGIERLRKMRNLVKAKNADAGRVLEGLKPESTSLPDLSR